MLAAALVAMVGSLAASVSAAPPTLAAPVPLALPGATGAVHLDDLQYDAGLGRVLVPAAETGNLDLVSPATLEVRAIPIELTPAQGEEGGAEVASAAVGDGFVFTADHGQQRLVAIDARTFRVVASAPLAAGPDYVRFVEDRHEVWVTEPRKAAIEVFALDRGDPPALRAVATIAVPGGPEALAIDLSRGLAYSNHWQQETVAIDLAKRQVAETWSSGCEGPRGLALDAPHGFLYVGCKDGTVTTLDVVHGGKVLSTLQPGEGTDIVAFDPERRHLYVPGARSATLAVLAVSDKGSLSLLGKAPAAEHSHCVTTDLAGGIYVCDPEKGRLLVYRDPFPASH